MLRIGLVGTESTHVDGLLRHVAERSDVVCVAAVPERGARRLPGLMTLESARDLVGVVDAVALMTRDGSTHHRLAMPLLEAGLRVWVDKPLALVVPEAAELLAAGDVTSFSTLRFLPESLAFRTDVDDALARGDLRGIGASGPADPSCRWCGAWFHGVHTIDLLGPWWGDEPLTCGLVPHGVRGRTSGPAGRVDVVLSSETDVPFTLWWEDARGIRHESRVPLHPGYFEPGAHRVVDFLAGGAAPVGAIECRRVVARTAEVVRAWAGDQGH